MAIAHDTQTRFPATDGTASNQVDTTTGNRTFSHAGGAGAKGVVVCVFSTGTTAVVTGVLYGGVAMTLVETATDTSEAGRLDIYALTSGVPTGTQTVTLQGATATGKWATCSTVTAATSQTQVAGSNHVNTTTSTNPTVTVATSAESLLYGGVHGGAAAPTSYTSGTGYTTQHSNDYGALSARSQRRTSPVAAGNVTFNFSFATSDDWCIAAVALAEFEPPILQGPTARGTLGPASTSSDMTTSPFTPTAGSILIAGVWYDQDSTPTISDSLGGTWTKVAEGNRDTDSQFAGFTFWQQVIGGSPASMTVTVGGLSASAHGGWVDEWTGQHTSSPTGATAVSSFASGASNPIQQAITTGADQSVVIGGLANWNSTTGSSADTGDTLDHESQVAGNAGGMVGHITAAVSPAGSATIGFNRQPSQDRGHIVAFELKADLGGGATDLVIANATHAQTAGAPTLTQVHQLAVASAAHAQTASNIGLTQAHQLAVQGATHAQQAGSLTLQVATSLAIADATHAQAAGAATLTQAHQLAVASAAHAQTASTPTLGQVHQLAVNPAAHAQTASAATLTQAHQLAVQSCLHAQQATTVDLSGAATLAIQSATHAHSASGLTLGQQHLLTIADAAHQQHADAATLMQLHQLAVQPAVHAQTATTLPALTGELPVTPPARTYAIPVETRAFHVDPDDRTVPAGVDARTLAMRS